MESSKNKKPLESIDYAQRHRDYLHDPVGVVSLNQMYARSLTLTSIFVLGTIRSSKLGLTVPKTKMPQTKSAGIHLIGGETGIICMIPWKGGLQIKCWSLRSSGIFCF